MTNLSVNLNKIALLRNQRDLLLPSVIIAAKTVIKAGATGITVHPRPDKRHVRPQDVRELRNLTRDLSCELNIEGNPQTEFLDLVFEVIPDQVTLVPDGPNARTSDHGWNLMTHAKYLAQVTTSLQQMGIRVSLFVDYDSDIKQVYNIGADAVELYTEPYARVFATQSIDAAKWIAQSFATSALLADQIGLRVHAGHDLNQSNLPLFIETIRQQAKLSEISIGHAFIAEALWQGLTQTTKCYCNILNL